MALAALAGATRPAHAAPDKCTVVSLIATCQGDQSGGLKAPTDFPVNTIGVVVHDLNRPMAPSAGDGISLNRSGALAALSIQFVGDAFPLSTVGFGHGLMLKHVSADGSGGSFGGGNGHAGSASAATTIRAHGTIDTRAGSGIYVELKAGNGGGGGSNVGTGGDGGAGGAGTRIDVQASGAIQTEGIRLGAVHLQSTGGDGGRGSGSGVAGSGGHGGIAGAGIQRLDLGTTGDWKIVTNPSNAQPNAPGILVEVTGGAGGHSGQGAGSGGHGGRGGDGSVEAVAIGSASSGTWRIDTRGQDSAAVQVKVTGGPGGDAGSSITSTGAPGGSGGNAGSLRAWNDTAMGVVASTDGSRSPAVFLQTTGGRGGVGGASPGDAGRGGDGGDGKGIALGTAAFKATLTTLADESPAVLLSANGGNGAAGGASKILGHGGDGGTGGSGGSIGVLGDYMIATAGRASPGIAAYSFGGDAGTGGKGSLFAGSGAGGAARPSEAVTLSVTGSIVTRGAESFGIVAESVAGHGGSAGDFGAFGFGASAGSAGIGGDVAVTSAAAIRTQGDQASAIAAASFGGGGGLGGASYGVYLARPGNASTGGHGGSVAVSNSGALTTTGHDALGILAESIGGTGGNGGNAGALIVLGGKSEYGGNGGHVTVSNAGRIATGAPLPSAAGAAPPDLVKICGIGCSTGILAQSIGGGGGNAGSAVGLFSVGSAGGGGGNGGQVDVENAGAISTTQVRSPALQVQSIGGGGGNGGGAFSVPLLPGLAVAVGGAGGTGGAGGDVSVSLLGGSTLTTRGADSRALWAQSIGAGGGTAGFAVSVGPSVIPALSVAIGGKGGDGGKGGVVAIVDTAASNVIDTSGARSDAVFAQSIGGGGGDGLFGFAASGASVVSFAGSVGGSGGKGGDGGIVSVTTAATVSTAGDDSAGIFAHSIGGGGGKGGFSLSAAISEVGISAGVGGSGGTGGNGSAINVTDSGESLVTRGKGSTGISAQSIGKGGGAGNFTVDLAGGTKGAVSVGIGGSGGGGGHGGRAVVANQSDISTFGAESTGIDAQSVGGGGGRGGLSVAGNLTLLGKGGATVSVGGGGGGGGAGGPVAVSNAGDISVHGAGSIGISAQSLGMGGGKGGMSLAGTLGIGFGLKQFSVSVGGGGGNAGGSGRVDVVNSGSIGTGLDAIDGLSAADAILRIHEHGIFAQAVGGGGGVGGMAGTLTVGLSGLAVTDSLNVGVSVGGTGGIGGVGGLVRVDNSGPISTSARESFAIDAQSIGGPGGQGGESLNYAVGGGQVRGNIAIAVGGHGGSGNEGGAVAAFNTGRLETSGANSHGIAAHSVGGGGGSGGAAGNTVFSLAGLNPAEDSANVRLEVGIGGHGGKAGHGGPVVVDNGGDVITRGPGSMGIYAYSVGGGGGDGGDATAIDHQFPGIPFVDRVKRFRNLEVNVGGMEGATGDGGTVSVTQRGGLIQTQGGDASAIYVQSIGGGGGRGGSSTGSLTTPSVSVGGSGSSGGNGGDVTVSVLGGAQIVTRGISPNEDAGAIAGGSFGIFAQSVGGGGGVGGNAKLQGVPFCHSCQVSIGIGLPIGLPGGAGGNGGKVAVRVEGQIATEGDDAAGIFAQSVGGGGGLAGASGPLPSGRFSALWSRFGSNGGPGSAGAITIDLEGSILTKGAGAHGIFAQSAGGGKKLPGAPLVSLGASGSSTSGDVTINVNGQIKADGVDAVGILAHSEGGDGNGNIVITVGKGSLVSGGRTGNTNQGAGIILLGGGDNVIRNGGTLTSQEGIAFLHTGGRSFIMYNTNTIQGDLSISAQTTQINNLPSGVIHADNIQLNGGTLNNEGILSPGGYGRVATTHFEGTLVQRASSGLAVDLDDARRGGASHADLLSLSAPTTLSGKVLVNLSGLGSAGPGDRTVTLVQSSGGVSHDNLTVESATGSDVVRYRLSQPSSSELVLDYDVDFANEAVLAHTNANQSPLARRLQAFYAAGALDPTLALKLAQASSIAYARDLDQFGAGLAVDTQIDSLRSAVRFGGDLRHCSMADVRCAWARLGGVRAKFNETSDNAGYTANSGQVAAGGEIAAEGGWRIGGALSWDNTVLRTAAAASSHGDRIQVGVGARRAFGALELSGSVALGEARNDLTRQLPEGGANVKSKQTVRSAVAWIGGAYAIGAEALYLKPRLDVGVVHLRMPAFDETGGEPLRLRVGSQSDTYAVLQPGIEMGTEFTQADGLRVRPRVAVAISRWIGRAAPSASATFASDPVGATPFTTTTRLDRTQAMLTAGLQMLGAKGTVVTADVLANASKNMRDYGLNVRLTMPF
jgi:hypothetical protein